MSPPMIGGLYPYTRGGVRHAPRFTLAEIPHSLKVNPSYRDDLVVLAGDEESARSLRSFGLHVHRVFADAPAVIHHDAAHKMKHWMCLWALREFGEFLWVDWDTVMLRAPDENFWAFCRFGLTPKFIRIPNYWATVNCGVYYADNTWISAMERSFDAQVSEPNDELLWASVLPPDVREKDDFWWGTMALNVWTEDECNLIQPDTYFAHVKDLNWASRLRSRVPELYDSQRPPP